MSLTLFLLYTFIPSTRLSVEIPRTVIPLTPLTMLNPLEYIYPASQGPTVWGALWGGLGTGQSGQDTYDSFFPSLMPDNLGLPTRMR